MHVYVCVYTHRCDAFIVSEQAMKMETLVFLHSIMEIGITDQTFLYLAS